MLVLQNFDIYRNRKKYQIHQQVKVFLQFQGKVWELLQTIRFDFELFFQSHFIIIMSNFLILLCFVKSDSLFIFLKFFLIFLSQLMNYSEQKKLPFIRNKSFSRKTILSISRIQESKSKNKPWESQRQKRQLSLKHSDSFKTQKRSLSHKKFSLKKISTQKLFKPMKLSQRNTDDSSEPDSNSETFLEFKKKDLVVQSLTERAVDILRNMKQVDRFAKLYKKDKTKDKNSVNSQESKKILKNKYKCLVNPHVFVRKSKHNNSDGAKPSKNKQKDHSSIGQNFWDKINESLILESSRHEQPSRELFDLVNNIRTEY